VLAQLACGQAASASTSLILTLSDLRKRTRRVVLGRPVLHESEWMLVGGSRRIITKTRFVQQHDWLKGETADDRVEDEFMVWTLGGRVGSLAQKVPGEAHLPLNEQVLLFVGEGADDHERIIGMSQGCYPIQNDHNGLHLQRSPHLPQLIGARPGPEAPAHARAAVDVLHNAEYHQAFSLIRGAR